MRIAPSVLVFAGLLGLSCSTWAHEGHGLVGASHWHAGDGALYLVGAALAAGLWLARGK